MKKLIIVFAFSLFSIGMSMGQNISFTPQWKAGNSFRYYLFKNKYNPNDKAYKQDADTIIVTFKVLLINNKGHDVEMRYDMSKSTAKPVKGLTHIINTVKKQQPVILRLDTSGKYIAVKNWAEIAKKCKEDILAEKSNAIPAEKETWDYLLKKLETQAQIEKYFTKDIEYFFMIYGSQLKRNRSFEYADEMRSPYADEMLPATTTLELKDDEQNPQQVEIKLYTLPDTVAGAQELKQIRELVRSRMDDPANYKGEPFELQDYYAFLYNTQTGINRTAIYLRYLREGDKEMAESVKFIAAD